MNVNQQNVIDNYIIHQHIALNNAIKNDNFFAAQYTINQIDQLHNPSLKEYILNCVTKSGTLLDIIEHRSWQSSKRSITQLLTNNGAVKAETKIREINNIRQSLCEEIANNKLEAVKQRLDNINNNCNINNLYLNSILNGYGVANQTPLDIAYQRLAFQNNQQGVDDTTQIINLLKRNGAWQRSNIRQPDYNTNTLVTAHDPTEGGYAPF